jgi:hypothetical protein
VQNDKTKRTYTKVSVHACISSSSSQILVFSAAFMIKTQQTVGLS